MWWLCDIYGEVSDGWGASIVTTVMESLTGTLRTEPEPEYAETPMPVRHMFDQHPINSHTTEKSYQKRTQAESDDARNRP